MPVFVPTSNNAPEFRFCPIYDINPRPFPSKVRIVFCHPIRCNYVRKREEVFAKKKGQKREETYAFVQRASGHLQTKQVFKTTFSLYHSGADRRCTRRKEQKRQGKRNLNLVQIKEQLRLTLTLDDKDFILKLGKKGHLTNKFQRFCQCVTHIIQYTEVNLE